MYKKRNQAACVNDTCPNMSKKLLSGKAKKQQLAEKREKDRLRAEREAAYHKRSEQQAESERAQALEAARAATSPTYADHSDEAQADEDYVGIMPPHLLAALKQKATTANKETEQTTANTGTPTDTSKKSTAGLQLTGGAATIYHKGDTAGEANKLRTVFAKEDKAVIEARKAVAREPLKTVEDGTTGCSSIDYYEHVIEMPIRPHWESSFSKERVEKNEEEMFKSWLEDVYGTYGQERLNHFEHNLNVSIHCSVHTA